MRSLIIIKKPEDLIWPFESTPHHDFRYMGSNYRSTIQVDPFPCTMHDVKIMKEEIEKIEEAFPIGSLLQWIVIPHEIVSRTNAYAYRNDVWGTDEEIKKKHKLDCQIIMSGKRTNIHPAMTKFLVGHEYGHQVDYWITKLMCEKQGVNDEDIFRKMYAEHRGISFDEENGYGGNRYKNNLTEMIADEFRIVVGRIDTDFWQHDKHEHPLTNGGLKYKTFWNNLKENFAFYD